MLMYVFSISRFQNVHYFALNTLEEWIFLHLVNGWGSIYLVVSDRVYDVSLIESSVKVIGYEFVLFVGK